MRDFDLQMNDCQTAWRRDHVKNQEDGEQHQKRRPWILPRELWEEGLWPGIRGYFNYDNDVRSGTTNGACHCSLAMFE